jgi:hypothetical protein
LKKNKNRGHLEGTIVNKILQELIQFQTDRRKPFIGESSPHKTVEICIGNLTVPVDEEIAPLVKWMNSLKGVKTQFSCQGNICFEHTRNRPYIIFFCEEESTIVELAKLAAQFMESNAVENYSLSLFDIKIRIEWWEGKVRYIIRWHDRLAMNDFIKWLKLDKM